MIRIILTFIYYYQYSNMGNSLIAQAKRELKSENYEWRIKSTMPFSSIVIDDKSKVQGQKYKIQYCLLQQEWRIYILRRNNPRYLVTVYDLIQDKDSFCSNNREVSVVIESIPYRLTDLGGLSFSDAMYILKCILEGYKKLVKNKLQFYLLDQANICFTKGGLCKFWINQNLYLSKPHPNRIIPQSTFITTVLQIIQMRIDQIDQQYTAMKAICQNLTLERMLDIVNCFHDSKVSYISSISSMGMFYSPSFSSQDSSIIMQKQINPQRNSQKKMSISKYKRQNRKKEQSYNQYKQINMNDIHESKKLSLSFNNSRRNPQTLKNELYQRQFVSPNKFATLSSIKFDFNSTYRENKIRKDKPLQFYCSNK